VGKGKPGGAKGKLKERLGGKDMGGKRNYSDDPVK